MQFTSSDTRFIMPSKWMAKNPKKLLCLHCTRNISFHRIFPYNHSLRYFVVLITYKFRLQLLTALAEMHTQIIIVGKDFQPSAILLWRFSINYLVLTWAKKRGGFYPWKLIPCYFLVSLSFNFRHNLWQ